jgi:23S rRNA (uracil1939-C5)-methyltransferase
VPETWVVERIAPGGEGFGRTAAGQIVFVPGALPGDEIQPDSIQRHRGYLRAAAWSLVRPGPERVAAPCPVAETCGGCGLMGLSRTAQLREKSGILGQALRRTGHLEVPSPPVQTVGPDLGYRHRVRLQVDDRGTVGFFAPRSHSVVPVERCAVALPALNEGLSALARAPTGSMSALESIELRAAPRGAPLVAVGRTRRGAGAAARRALDRAVAGVALPWIAGDPPGDAPEQRYPLPGGIELRAGPETFTQINWPVNERLVADLVASAAERHVRSFADLYAGAGNFALPLLAAGLTGLAVERDAEAVRRARRAAVAEGLPEATFRAGTAEGIARDDGDSLRSVDLVVLDPPRAGAQAVLPALLRVRPRWIALVACDPVVLARDLRALREGGYTIEQVAAYDMFPHTHHLESVAWLTDAHPSSSRLGPAEL